MRIGVAAALIVALMGMAACGDDRPGDDVAVPATDPPDSAPEIVGVVTRIATFEPVTQDCVEPDPDADPDAPVSSHDPPSCTDPDTPILGTVLVEESPYSTSGDRKISFTVERGTALLAVRDGDYEAASFGDLSEGQRVRAWSTGELRESYPEQGDAAAIVIEENT